MNQLMPAELVAKDCELDYLCKHGLPAAFMADDEADEIDLNCIRHAWIVAAEWLEERAELLSQVRTWHYGCTGKLMSSVQTIMTPVAEELYAAARELRRAAREDVEP